MRCILEGHSFKRCAGQGEFAGRQFDVCLHCGKTYEIDARGVRADQPMPEPLSAPRFPAMGR